MTIPFEKLKARLLANPKVKAEYDALAPEFEISAELIRARVRAGLSQAELAALDIAEDRFVTATGSYSATASLSGSAAWVMQVATFKAAS